jgi:hypothetical protein
MVMNYTFVAALPMSSPLTAIPFPLPHHRDSR